jgi:hypothetical protein
MSTVNLGELALSTLAGGVVGIAASIAAWKVITTRYVPSFEVSAVRKRVDESVSSGAVYGIKVVNTMRHAALMEVTTVVQLGLRHGATEDHAGTLVWYLVPTHTLGGQAFPIVEHYTIHVLRVHEIGRDPIRFPDDLARGLRDGSVGLDDILDAPPGAQLRVGVVASHSRSGIRTGLKLSRVPVLTGEFAKGRSTQIIESVKSKEKSAGLPWKGAGREEDEPA